MPFHAPPDAQPGDPDYGPLWTGPVPDESLQGNPFAPRMTLDIVNVLQHEAFHVGGTPERRGRLSVHLEWRPGVSGDPFSPTGYLYSFRSDAARFAGDYLLSEAHVDFSFNSVVSLTDNSVFTFASNPKDQRVIFAQVGHEVNGIFLPAGTPR
jgi:hypothetical protein